MGGYVDCEVYYCAVGGEGDYGLAATFDVFDDVAYTYCSYPSCFSFKTVDFSS